MYKKVGLTRFGVGEINSEYIISYIGEFDYRDNVLIGSFDLDTYEDEQTGIVLYSYNDTLVTVKELRREYLKDYYKVKD